MQQHKMTLESARFKAAAGILQPADPARSIKDGTARFLSMLTLFNLQKSGKLLDVLKSSRGEGSRVFGLRLADAAAMTNLV
jgi:hypothetical protein